jgi:hypothetical protein
MGKLNLRKLRKEYSSIPVMDHHKIEFSHGENKHE